MLFLLQFLLLRLPQQFQQHQQLFLRLLQLLLRQPLLLWLRQQQQLQLLQLLLIPTCPGAITQSASVQSMRNAAACLSRRQRSCARII